MDLSSPKLERELDLAAGGPAQLTLSLSTLQSPSQTVLKSPAKLQLDFQSLGKRPLWQQQRTLQSPVMPHLQGPRSPLVSPVGRLQHPTEKFPVKVLQVVEHESPRSQPQSNAGLKDKTPTKRKLCNCKSSRCLKLYCECFATGIYCDGCNCLNCHNKVDNEPARQEAIGITLERNPNAFRRKIAGSPLKPEISIEKVSEIQVQGKHNKGCHCKKTGCLKRYCECFQSNILCSGNCKCMDCKNFEGSDELRVHQENCNILVQILQADNSATSEAVGNSNSGTHITPKKRKIQEIFSGKSFIDETVNMTNQYRQGHHSNSLCLDLKSYQTNKELAPIASSPLSMMPCYVSETANTRFSKSTYRSVLADVLQTQRVKNICSHLVVLSGEAAKTDAEMRVKVVGKIENGKYKASIASSSQSLQDSRNVVKPVCENRANKDVADVVDIDIRNRPMSPETLKLMCDEDNGIFFGNDSSNGVAFDNTYQNMIQKKSSNTDGCTDAYAEQERIILTSFRDVLGGLIALGSIKEAIYHSLLKKDASLQKEPTENGDGGAETKGNLGKCSANCSIPLVSEIYHASYAKNNGHDINDLSLRLPAD